MNLKVRKQMNFQKSRMQNTPPPPPKKKKKKNVECRVHCGCVIVECRIYTEGNFLVAEPFYAEYRV